MESFGEICRAVIWSDCRKHYLHQFVKINLWRTAGKSGPFLEAIAEIQTKDCKETGFEEREIWNAQIYRQIWNLFWK